MLGKCLGKMGWTAETNFKTDLGNTHPFFKNELRGMLQPDDPEKLTRRQA